MKPWKRIEPTTVRVVSHRTIVTKTFVLPDGQTTQFGTVWPEGQQFVHVIALTPDHQVVVCELFRPGPEKVMQELPGGYVDAGELPASAAVRELLEETGYAPGKLAYLGPSHKDTYMNATWHSYLATDCAKAGAQKLEPEEQIVVKLISIKQLLRNARHDNMTDALAVFYAEDKLKQLQEMTA